MGLQAPQGAVVPPGEPAVTDGETRGQVNNGLGIGSQVAVADRDAEVVHRDRRLGSVCRNVADVDFDGTGLGFVRHGRRGSSDHRGRVVARRAGGDTTRDGHDDLSARGRDRRIDQRLVHDLRDAQRLSMAANTTQQETKVMIVNSSDGVDGSRDTRDPPRERAHDCRGGELANRVDHVVRTDLGENKCACFAPLMCRRERTG